MMKVTSTVRQDFIASHLRSQLNRLNVVLGVIEGQGEIDCEYLQGTLREIEAGIRQIRVMCASR